MDILIFSDSHGSSHNINEALSRQKTAPAAVIFLGDGLRDLEYCDTGSAELYCVRGNCDFYSQLENEEQTVILGGIGIFMTHGHRYMVKNGYSVAAEKAMRKGADVLLFGHTHLPTLDYIRKGARIGDTVAQKPLWVFNPGSIREGHFGTLTVRGGSILLNNASL